MTMHTYPLNDLREHETDKGAFCWCRPEYDEEYDLYVHRSMDGREEYEAMAEQYVTNCYFDTLEYAKAIEAKLKEKNT